MTSFLYLDLESLPAQDDDAKARIAASVKPPAQMKKADTIAAWEQNDKPAAVEEAIAKTSFNGALGHVACIGWAFDDDEPQSIIWPMDVSTEAATIHTFKTIIETRTSFAPTIVGHNVSEFDIRFLWQRAMVLGIRMPAWFPRNVKPWSNEVFDTMVAFSGQKDRISLDNLALALGLGGKGDIDGSMVADMWANQRYSEIAEYCRSDVALTRAIHKRMLISFGDAA